MGETKFSKTEIEERKKSHLRCHGQTPARNRFMKKGYDKWDPVQEPKDPIDIRKDKTQRTSQQLIREFLSAIPHEEYSNSYAQGALEMCLGIINDEEKVLGMYDFARLVRRVVKKRGVWVPLTLMTL